MSFVVMLKNTDEQLKFEQYHDALDCIIESFRDWNAFHDEVAFDIGVYKVPDANELGVHVSDEVGISESLGP